MKKNTAKLPFLLLFAPAFLLPLLLAQDVPPPPSPSSSLPSASSSPAAQDRDKPRPIKDVLPDAKKIEGLFTFYQKKDRLLAEIKGSNLNTDYLIAIAVAKGSGTNPIGGYTYLANGSDWLWQFRKVNDTIQVVRRNIQYKADPGTPEARAVEVGYSDSILYSLPIVAAGEGGGDVIDLASIFMADLPRLGIGSFDRSRSNWGDVKGFPNNMEFRVAATYSGGRNGASPDPSITGVTLHYSISKLPSSSYTPRQADQRVGYFIVSHKNFSRAAEDNHNIRYITRWNLQKADPSAALSSPKKPIVFWIEKSVPFKYRNAVREGILEWNKAFEKVGIVGAIEVRQQSETDTWDAEDINYNTIRWITSDRGFAMGPSRVNPLTGEILDADIIFDAAWVTHWQERFDYLIADVLPPEPGKRESALLARKAQSTSSQGETDEEHSCSLNGCTCNYVQEKAAHFALASLAFALDDEDEGTPEDKPKAKDEEKKPEEKEGDSKSEEGGEEPKKEDKEDQEKKDAEKKEEEKTDGEAKKDEPKKPSPQNMKKEREEKFERLVLAGIKDVVMHEVGHTLGLRHNFQASSWLTLDEINDPNRSKEFGFAGSVMDYMPINIAPKGKPQGDYFMPTLGPYDYLAIEYGYKSLSGDEKKELAKIAARQAEAGNNYAPDEDISNTDPRTQRYDFGKNPLEFSQWGLELYNQLLPEILDRAIREDGQYRDVGKYYMLLVNQRHQADTFLIRNLVGLYRNRDRKGDPGDRPPIQVIDAQTQRDTVRFLCDNTFGADAFKVAPEIYNRFGGEIWLSGESIGRTPQVSLGKLSTQLQCITLTELLGPWTFDALTDTALRVPESEDVYTIDELLSTVAASIFSELDTIKEGEFSSRKPAIPATRRALQDFCFLTLAEYAAGEAPIPDINSSRSLARSELSKLEAKIQAALTGNAQNWDAGSTAHLTMLRDRIKKLLEASLFSERP